MSKPVDLVQGTLDLLLLKILALEPLHGWAISQRLAQMSNTTLQVSDGSLYPALHKLELEGWIRARALGSLNREGFNATATRNENLRDAPDGTLHVSRHGQVNQHQRPAGSPLRLKWRSSPPACRAPSPTTSGASSHCLAMSMP